MPRRQQVSIRQLEIIVDFVETHRDLVVGRMGGPMGNQACRQAWQNLALKLNSLGDGIQKTWEQWRRYWVEWKARTRAKAADSRRMMRGTGGGPNRLEPLSPLEERILALIGKVAVEGLPDVRVPLDESSHCSPSILVSGETLITNIDEYIVPVQSQEIVELQAPLFPDFVPDEQAAVLEDNVQATSSTATDIVATHTQAQGIPTATSRRTPLFQDVVLDDQAAAVLEDTVDATPTQAQGIPTAASRRTQSRRRRQNIPPSFHQDARAPRWAYELEERRLANEERSAAALENVSAHLAAIVGALNKIIVVIQNK